MGIGDVGNMVLRDRKNLAEHGMLTIVIARDKQEKSIVCSPDIVSRGFVYVREAENLMEEAKSIVYDALQRCIDKS